MGDVDPHDSAADPYELRSLVGEAKHQERLKEFRGQVLDWWQEAGGEPLRTKWG